MGQELLTVAWKDGDDAAVERLVGEHRRQLDARVTRLRGALQRIDHLLAEGLQAAMTETDPDDATPTTKSPPGTGSVTDARLLAAQLFNETWRLMELEGRSRDDDDRMIHTAHASRYHWGQAPGATPANLARGEWQLSRAPTPSPATRPRRAIHQPGPDYGNPGRHHNPCRNRRAVLQPASNPVRVAL